MSNNKGTTRLAGRLLGAIIGLVLFVAVVLLALRYGNSAGRASDTEARSETGSQVEAYDRLEEIIVILDWTPNVNHLGLFVAQSRGLFAEQGLTVEIKQPAEVYAPAAVAAGQADFGVDFQENLTLLHADGVPLVSIAAVLQHNTSGFAVRADADIASPADFEGLRYATFQSPFERPTIDALVRCAGGNPEEIEFVPGGENLLAMLQSNRADLAWIYWGTQGFQAQRLGISLTYFPLSDYYDCIPDSYTPIIITTQELLDNRPDIARRFLAALSQGHHFAARQPQQAAEIMADAVPELDRAELAASAAWLAQWFFHPQHGWGWQEEQVWSDYARWMASNQLPASEAEIASAFSNQYLPMRDN